ncbi:DUF1223 domain-containing protein [Limobrevibacterium gyesilva]|uniref:DUF1223 domain-containing protein n=1 Tax=Limobrevibacterium gyesilva TaxID=2991712 RepID=A0AA41YKR6_9PROT|nr:DUF1223 domain-containing protein [Limobrevibacterium gyesilva]MCW3475581.1 DUF1223 domain-containing protein [Limobrevibacterium gyesilva]
MRKIGLSLVLLAVATLPVHAADGVRPVVIELFTSQGCSSCPPADQLLTELARTRPDVLPLAFHVTYWNNLGWRDPYSLDAATTRQRGYTGVSGLGTIYTPQAIVDGTRDIVGSDRDGVIAALDKAAATATALPLGVTRDGDEIAITVGSGAGAGKVLLIGYDGQHVTKVGRGENAGATLLESNIVRALEPVADWQGAELGLRHAAPAGEHAAVIVQAPDGRILAAARVPDAPAKRQS